MGVEAAEGKAGFTALCFAKPLQIVVPFGGAVGSEDVRLRLDLLMLQYFFLRLKISFKRKQLNVGRDQVFLSIDLSYPKFRSFLFLPHVPTDKMESGEMEREHSSLKNVEEDVLADTSIKYF